LAARAHVQLFYWGPWRIVTIRGRLFQERDCPVNFFAHPSGRFPKNGERFPGPGAGRRIQAIKALAGSAKSRRDGVFRQNEFSKVSPRVGVDWIGWDGKRAARTIHPAPTQNHPPEKIDVLPEAPRTQEYGGFFGAPERPSSKFCFPAGWFRRTGSQQPGYCRGASPGARCFWGNLPKAGLSPVEQAPSTGPSVAAAQFR